MVKIHALYLGAVYFHIDFIKPFLSIFVWQLQVFISGYRAL